MLDLIRKHFRLEGEAVIRLDTGKPIRPHPGRKSYAQAGFWEGGKYRVLRLHVVKFALAHGYLPPRVDHKDRDIKNDLLANLRAATVAQNAYNTGRPVRGFTQDGNRYRAYINHAGKQVHLGLFETREEALRVALAARRKLHGEFYAGS